MANILKILLYREEVGLACLLTVYYELALDELMIRQAIYCEHYEWLNFLWAFEKNFLNERSNKEDVDLH